MIERKRQLEQILDFIVRNHLLHGKFLNTISYLENCGARKIAACEHPTLVKKEVLKHASEEFRHAHYLKCQIQRVSKTPFLDYNLSNIMGGFPTLHYLNQLDLKASRYLRYTLCLDKAEIIEIAYLLVTYAIEIRAEEFYPIYHNVLKKHQSKVTVKSILLEEEEHLEEMRLGISKIPSGFKHAEVICKQEENLFDKWIHSLQKELELAS